MSFQIDSSTYTIPASSYLVSYENAQMDVKMCHVAVTWDQYQSDVIGLGLPFLQNFVPTFDFKSHTVSFGLSTSAAANTLVTNKLSPLDVGIIVASTVVGLIIIGIVVKKCFMKKE